MAKTNIMIEITKIQADLGYIKKAIAGNGENGLLKDTKENTEFRLRGEGSLSLIKWLFAVLSGTVLLSIFNFIRHIMK